MADQILGQTSPGEGWARRLFSRLICEFLTDVLAKYMKMHGGDLDRALVFMTISQASTAYLASDPVLVEHFNSDFPLDELARPISVNAVATTLSFSQETTRRHVLALIEAGLCARIDSRGVILPSSYLKSSDHLEQIADDRATFEKMIKAFYDLDLDVGSAAGEPAKRLVDLMADKQPPARLVSWHVNDYVLRVVLDGLQVHKDYFRGLIYAMGHTANARNYIHDKVLAWRYSHLKQAPADDFRTPMRISHIARRLSTPYATTRRYALEMIRDGVCIEVDGGLIIPEAYHSRPEVISMGFRAHQWFLGMLRSLKGLGYDFEPYRGPTCAGGLP